MKGSEAVKGIIRRGEESEAEAGSEYGKNKGHQRLGTFVSFTHRKGVIRSSKNEKSIRTRIG